MVASNVSIHKPLVLNGTGSIPTHVGCVIDGDKWEFRASPNVEYVKGQIVLDTVYASGQFSRVNPAYDESAPSMFDFNAKLASSRGSVTGDEFYEAIPSAYRYQRHFKDYLKVVHEIDDDNSWDGKAYLTRLEVPEGTPDVFGHGYVIHPGILDSITQCGLAMFINMDTKLFDFNGVSEGRVLFTIEGFEIARAPDAEPVAITDNSLEERLTTAWQAKAFPAVPFALASEDSLSGVFKAIVGAAGRKVVRAIDLAQTTDISTGLDVILGDLKQSGVLVEYFCAAGTPEDADSKTGLLKHSHVRSLAIESWKFAGNAKSTSVSLTAAGCSSYSHVSYAATKLFSTTLIFLLFQLIFRLWPTPSYPMVLYF